MLQSIRHSFLPILSFLERLERAGSFLQHLSLLRETYMTRIPILPYWSNCYVLQVDSTPAVAGVFHLFNVSIFLPFPCFQENESWKLVTCSSRRMTPVSLQFFYVGNWFRALAAVVGRMHVGHLRSWDWDQQKDEATSVRMWWLQSIQDKGTHLLARPFYLYLAWICDVAERFLRPV